MFLLVPIKGVYVTRGISATSTVIKHVAEYDPCKSNSWSTSAGDYFPTEESKTFSRQWQRHGIECKQKRATWMGTGMLKVLLFGSILKKDRRTCLHVRLISKVNSTSQGFEIAFFLCFFHYIWYLPHYLLLQNHSFMYKTLHLISRYISLPNERLVAWYLFHSWLHRCAASCELTVHRWSQKSSRHLNWN